MAGEVGGSDSALTPEEMACVYHILSSWEAQEKSQVAGVNVETENHIESALATELREKLYADYKDSVFRDEIFPNPQPRGPHGMANIKLKAGAKPVCKRAIPCHGAKFEALRKLIEKWRGQQKLEPPEPSAWGSPMFLVEKPHKPEDPYRPVFDLRGPNVAAEPDCYTIPLIDETIMHQGRKNLWSVLDLKDAFSQVPLAPEARHIFRFTTPLGDFQPTVMPQGYTNAPSIFQREMDFCLEELRHFACAYFDDVIVGTEKESTETPPPALMTRKKFSS